MQASKPNLAALLLKTTSMYQQIVCVCVHRERVHIFYMFCETLEAFFFKLERRLVIPSFITYIKNSARVGMW